MPTKKDLQTKVDELLKERDILISKVRCVETHASRERRELDSRIDELLIERDYYKSRNGHKG